MQRRNIALAILCAALAVAAHAAEEEALEDVPEAAPPPPPRVQSGEALEPEVTIRQKEEETLEEYRSGGQLYLVKVTPAIGKPYYLLDSDGDGKLETRMSHLYSNFVVPSWVILSW